MLHALNDVKIHIVQKKYILKIFKKISTLEFVGKSLEMFLHY